jgi:type I restriction enzyme S subunit
MYKLAQGSTRFNLSKKSFLKNNLLFPCIEEQKKIATLLEFLSELKEYQLKKIKHMEVFKKGLLQKMFI